MNRIARPPLHDSSVAGVSPEDSASQAAPSRRQRARLPRLNSSQNRLLAQIPAEIYREIAPELEPVSIQSGQVVSEVGDRAKYLYFPSKNTMLSLMCLTGDATAVEIGVTGWEGFAGFAALLGGDSPHRVIGQIPGAAVRIHAGVLEKYFQDGPPLRNVLLRYVQALLIQISRTALCNSIHSVEERLARWALVSKDRTDLDELPLTHDLLARMLGVNRSTVSLIAATLQRAGMIRYTRGRFTVLDRERLEDVACDCYRTVNEQYQRLGIL